jgi:hypothetical protein
VSAYDQVVDFLLKEISVERELNCEEYWCGKMIQVVGLADRLRDTSFQVIETAADRDRSEAKAVALQALVVAWLNQPDSLKRGVVACSPLNSVSARRYVRRAARREESSPIGFGAQDARRFFYRYVIRSEVRSRAMDGDPKLLKTLDADGGSGPLRALSAV